MTKPEIGDSITLDTANRDRVLLFIRECSEWVAAFEPSSLDEPPVIDPNDHGVIVESLYRNARVDVGDTVVYSGTDQLTIRSPHGGEDVLDLEKSE